MYRLDRTDMTGLFKGHGVWASAQTDRVRSATFWASRKTCRHSVSQGTVGPGRGTQSTDKNPVNTLKPNPFKERQDQR